MSRCKNRVLPTQEKRHPIRISTSCSSLTLIEIVDEIESESD